MSSAKELALDVKIREELKSLEMPRHILHCAELLMNDPEIHAMQDYGNTVSIKRLGFNDHGPVHMRTVALNALIMMGLLRKAGVKLSLENEECGTFEDGLAGVLCATLIHDLGMTIGRQDHELHSAYLSYPILDRILRQVYLDAEGKPLLTKIVMVRSLAIEAIAGHMGNRAVYSLEAGLVQVADGCDMEKGRARIPMALSKAPSVGDIHQYSAHAIQELRIIAGNKKPIRIEVLMSSEVGLFQIEEVLLAKIHASTAKPYIELFATLEGSTGPKQYL
jgi:metal-dependent HD superfamily phosphatase/phosphodiesterase